MISDPQVDEKTLAIKQALKYAEDLSSIYQKEKQRRKALEIANEKINVIIDSMSDGMIAIDENYTIIEINQIGCQLLEQNREDLLGQDLSLFFDFPSPQKINQWISTASSNTIPFQIEVPLPCRKTAYMSITNLKDDTGYVCILYDITTQKRNENLKNEFLSILTHELKTPLNSILGFSDILNQGYENELSTEHKEFFNNIKEAGKRMLKTVNELIQFASFQIKNQEIEILKDQWILNDLIHDIISILELEIKEKGVSVEIQIKVERAIVNGNSYLLDLFYHIIHNAVQYNKTGGRIRIQLMKDQNYYKTYIEDNGIGIPSRDLNNIFESFFQVEGHYSRHYEGLGLGLTLAKRIAEFHGGKITLESRLNKGTICCIELPAAIDHQK